MKITKLSDRPHNPGLEKNFTGAVTQTLLHALAPPSKVVSGLNTFAPKARTVWHTHPVGQLLYVVSGTCRIQKFGEPVQELHAGDTVWFEAEEKHWHGASANGPMTHISVQEVHNGSAVTWMEPVTDPQYLGHI